jgi:hypothetical protein
VGYLASEQCEDSGTLQEVFGGYAAGVRWQRTFGAVLPNDVDPTPEQILTKWKEITTFGQSAAMSCDKQLTNQTSELPTPHPVLKQPSR